MTPEPHAIVDILRAVAATEIIPRYRSNQAAEKADGSLVTEADLATQARIFTLIAERYPHSRLLGEEMPKAEQERLLAGGESGVWILDPLDGTSNYACGFPAFSVSIAYIEAGEVVLGVVLDPIRDECFHATRGGGAFLDGVPIRPFAPGPRLGDCLAMIDMKRLPPQRIPALFRSGGFRSQRNLGSVALDWCWLAAGRYQLYLHGGQKLWDYAAGRLIANEAGAATHLFARGGASPDDRLTLDSRLAIAASDADLLARWLEFVGLPMT